MFEIKRTIAASDMGVVCKILTGIGVKEFQGCFKNIDIKGKSAEAIGYSVVFDVAGIILSNIPKVQGDIDSFLASLTDQDVKDIQGMNLGEYGELIVAVIQKDEFKDFFSAVMKLFNQ